MNAFTLADHQRHARRLALALGALRSLSVEAGESYPAGSGVTVAAERTVAAAERLQAELERAGRREHGFRWPRFYIGNKGLRWRQAYIQPNGGSTGPSWRSKQRSGVSSTKTFVHGPDFWRAWRWSRRPARQGHVREVM